MAMTEQEWLASDEPDKMLGIEQGRVAQVPEYLQSKLTQRKLRLFACACCRRIWHLISDERSRRALETAERFAEGQATPDELRQADRIAEEVCAHVHREVYETLDAAFRTLDPSVDFFYGADDEAAVAASAFAAVDCTVSSCPPNEPIYLAGSAESARWAIGHAAAPLLVPEDFERIDRERRTSAEMAEGTAQAALIRDITGNPFRPVTLNPAWRTSNVTALAQAIYDDRAFDRLPILADALEDAGCDNADILNHCRQPGEHVRGCWVVDLVLGRD
jgi:hypothetical protein